MDQNDRESIINEITERMLLKIPEIVGNLIEYYSKKLTVSKNFYDKYPEFKNYRDIVASTIERIENKYPGDDIESIINRAVPEIRSIINSSKSIDTSSVKYPNIKFGHGEIDGSS